MPCTGGNEKLEIQVVFATVRNAAGRPAGKMAKVSKEKRARRRRACARRYTGAPFARQRHGCVREHMDLLEAGAFATASGGRRPAVDHRARQRWRPCGAACLN